MPTNLDLSVVIVTYQRPAHLERSLASLAMQRGVTGRFEVIVADDGSDDRTHEVAHQFARTVDFPVKFVTHPHQGFRVSLCRNDGVRASEGEYLLFTDNDCIMPPNHLERHLCARRPGIARAGNRFRLDREASERLTVADVAAGNYRKCVSRMERLSVWRRWISDVRYQLIGHRTKPRLMGYNIAISRRDLEAVNGFDEEYVGWGCEDDDLAVRLRLAGIRIASATAYTQTYHLWHPDVPSHPGSWRNGANVELLLRRDRPIRCRCGLVRLADRAEDDSASSRGAAA